IRTPAFLLALADVSIQLRMALLGPDKEYLYKAASLFVLSSYSENSETRCWRRRNVFTCSGNPRSWSSGNRKPIGRGCRCRGRLRVAWRSYRAINGRSSPFSIYGGNRKALRYAPLHLRSHRGRNGRFV